jgi:ribonuclease P protein component
LTLPASGAFLSHRAQFKRTAYRGKKITGNFWLLRFIVNNAPAARLGVVIGKRHINLATRRNRLRRTVREGFRQRWQSTLPSIDIFAQLISKHKPATLSLTDDTLARDEFFQLLAKITQKHE